MRWPDRGGSTGSRTVSPSLFAAIENWRRCPRSRKGSRTEAALVRYLFRMTARATPFGLFAGYALGTVGSVNKLQLASRQRYRRHTRLDMDYLYRITADRAPTVTGKSALGELLPNPKERTDKTGSVECCTSKRTFSIL
ncbi:MAG: hypothetical protein GY835_19425 [bacterium]|nr:hypothetical protein [bacterium]